MPNKVTLLHEQLRNNLKVELRWLLLTELTQIFLCDSVSVSSNRKSKIENRKLDKKNRKSKIENRKKKKKIEKNLNNLNNFKVQLRWLPLTESTQIFLCDSVCVSSNRKSKIENRKSKKKNRKSKIKNRKSKIKKKKKIGKKNRKGGL